MHAKNIHTAAYTLFPIKNDKGPTKRKIILVLKHLLCQICLLSLPSVLYFYSLNIIYH